MIYPTYQGIIHYTLSAHGGDYQTYSEILPTNGEIYFYVPECHIYVSLNNFQTHTCSGNTYPKEVIGPGNHYPSSMFFTKDEQKKWYSGVVDCNDRTIVINIDSYDTSITLGQVIQIIDNYHNKKYPNYTFRLHVLTCRVDLNKSIDFKHPITHLGYRNSTQAVETNISNEFERMSINSQVQNQNLKKIPESTYTNYDQGTSYNKGNTKINIPLKYNDFSSSRINSLNSEYSQESPRTPDFRNTSVFGSKPQSNTGAFGSQPQSNTGAFGSQPQSNFGAFGSKSQSNTGAFGSKSQSNTGAFGSQSQSNFGAFGSQSQSNFGAFGSQPQSNFRAFGSQPQSNTGAFGSQPQSNTGAFGSQPQSNFGAFGSQPQSNTGAFGSQPQSNFGAFGSKSQSNFGAFGSQPQSNTWYGTSRSNYVFGSTKNKYLKYKEKYFIAKNNCKKNNISQII